MKAPIFLVCRLVSSLLVLGSLDGSREISPTAQHCSVVPTTVGTLIINHCVTSYRAWQLRVTKLGSQWAAVLASSFRALLHRHRLKKHLLSFHCSPQIMHHFFLEAFKFSLFSSSARMFLGDFLWFVLIKFVELSWICGLWSFVGLLTFSASTVHMWLPHQPLPRVSLWGLTCTGARSSLCPTRLALCIFTPFPSTLPSGAFLRTLTRPLSVACYDLLSNRLFACSFRSFYTLLLECPYASLPLGFTALMKFSIFHSRSRTYWSHFKVPSTWQYLVTSALNVCCLLSLYVTLGLHLGILGKCDLIVAKKTVRPWGCFVQREFLFCQSHGSGLLLDAAR